MYYNYSTFQYSFTQYFIFRPVCFLTIFWIIIHSLTVTTRTAFHGTPTFTTTWTMIRDLSSFLTEDFVSSSVAPRFPTVGNLLLNAQCHYIQNSNYKPYHLFCRIYNYIFWELLSCKFEGLLFSSLSFFQQHSSGGVL